MTLVRALPRQSFVGLRAAARRHFSSTRPAMSILKSYLVTPQELAAALESSPPTHSTLTSSSSPEYGSSTAPASTTRVIPLCASWFLPNDPEGRTGAAVFEASRIPHARFFDLDAVKDDQSPYPHMLPTAEDFAAAMSRLGISRTDAVVVYDSAELGIFSAPRVAWTLKVFGHERVHVLNNYRLWKEEGLPVETGAATATSGGWERTRYPVPKYRTEKVATFREIRDMVRRKRDGDGREGVQIVDLRSRGRFDGTAPEPRPGLSSGHMPGSINVPLPELLDPRTGAYLPVERLKAVFEARGVDPERPIISTCGTGVMAAACDLALRQAGFGQPGERRVYDGSWTEYAQRVGDEQSLIVKKTA